MVTVYRRDEWTSRAARCHTAMPITGVQDIVRHWPGTTAKHLQSDPTSVAGYLRGWQSYHMDTRGWCDIAYQWAVDRSAGIWELRGFGNKSGAHTPHNEEGYAILLILGAEDTVTPAMLQGLRYLRDVALLRTPTATGWLGHYQVPGASTACPGPAGKGITLTDLEEEDDMELTDTVHLFTGQGVDYSSPTTDVEHVLASTNLVAFQTRNKVVALAADVGALEAVLAAHVAADPANTLTAEQVVAAARDGAAQALAAGIDLRVTVDDQES